MHHSPECKISPLKSLFNHIGPIRSIYITTPENQGMNQTLYLRVTQFLVGILEGLDSPLT